MYPPALMFGRLFLGEKPGEDPPRQQCIDLHDQCLRAPHHEERACGSELEVDIGISLGETSGSSGVHGNPCALRFREC